MQPRGVAPALRVHPRKVPEPRPQRPQGVRRPGQGGPRGRALLTPRRPAIVRGVFVEHRQHVATIPRMGALPIGDEVPIQQREPTGFASCRLLHHEVVTRNLVNMTPMTFYVSVTFTSSSQLQLPPDFMIAPGWAIRVRPANGLRAERTMTRVSWGIQTLPAVRGPHERQGVIAWMPGKTPGVGQRTAAPAGNKLPIPAENAGVGTPPLTNQERIRSIPTSGA